MINSAEKTAHQDGYRVLHELRGGVMSLQVKMFAGGKAVPEFDIDLGSLLTDNTTVNLERSLLVAESICRFFNVGGSRADLFRLLDIFAQKAAPLKSPYELLTVLAPAAGIMSIWKRPDGRYLRIVDGPDGFVETLTETEAREVLSEAVQDGSTEDDDDDSGDPVLG